MANVRPQAPGFIAQPNPRSAVPPNAVLFAPLPPNLDPSTPPGLGYLRNVDQLVVEQQIDTTELFTGYEANNRYLIKNRAGQVVYYAVDMSDFLNMNVLGSMRPFDILVMDSGRACVMKVSRPFRGEGLSLCGIMQEIQVMSGVGQLLGTIVEVFQWCSIRYRVQNSVGQTVLYIQGPCCRTNFIDIDFDIVTADGRDTKVGVITRQFPGFFKQMFTNADVFGVRFPIDLDTGVKAVLVAATFLIDFMYYQNKTSDFNNNNNNRY